MNMSKVRWDAKSAHEYVGNYKILQQVLQKKGVDKYIDVEKLMRGKYQDNLENMQWFKVGRTTRAQTFASSRSSNECGPSTVPEALVSVSSFAACFCCNFMQAFYERNASSAAAAAAAAGLPPYDPTARRAKGRGADLMPAFTTLAGGAVDGSGADGGAASSSSRDVSDDAPKSARGGAGSGASSSSSYVAAGAGVSARATGAGTGAGSSSTGAASGIGAPAEGSRARAGAASAAAASTSAAVRPHAGAGPGSGAASGPSGGAGSAVHQLAAVRRELSERDSEIAELRAACASLERERDFYFGKLREIEILTQVYNGPDKRFVEQVCGIMYATEEDFVAMPDAGTAVTVPASGTAAVDSSADQGPGAAADIGGDGHSRGSGSAQPAHNADA